MRCYWILVHGEFEYHVSPVPSGIDFAGFYAGRSLFARDEEDAIGKAFAKVRKGLAKWNTDMRDGLISARLNVDEVSRVPFWHAWRRSNRGHTFYGD